MNQTKKRIGSLFLAVCVAVTMLPMAVFAETGDVDSGNAQGSDGTITAFAKLDEDIAAQLVETGTPEEELNLPEELEVIATIVTDDAGDVSGIDTATDSEAQNPEAQEEDIKTTVAVSRWTSKPVYDGDAEGKYIFTPKLDLPDGLAIADNVNVPSITVTVTEPVKAGVMPAMIPTALADLEIIQGPSDQSISIGGTASFTVEVNGAPELTYQWGECKESPGGGSTNKFLSDGGYYSGTTTKTLIVTGVPGSYDGLKYQCRISSGGATITSLEATLTVTDGGTGTLTGTMIIGGQNIPLAVSRSESGWSWDASETTLTLNSSYPNSECIDIKCDKSDDISLVLAGNVTIQNGSSSVFRCAGNLNIKAGDYKLDLSSPAFWVVLDVGGSLEIESGTVIATGSDGANAIRGLSDVIISGASTNVTGNGNIVSFGDFEVSDGTVIVTGNLGIFGNRNFISGTVIVGGNPVFPEGATWVKWSNLTANGTANQSDTTELTLAFDGNPPTLTQDDINVTGAGKGILKSSGDNTLILEISNITVDEGENVRVTLSNPTGYAITPLSMTVPIHKAPTAVPVESFGVTVGGVEVTAANADNITGSDITGSIRYDAAAKTLTLTDAFIRRDQYLTGTGIWSEHDLTVRLVGNNVLGELNNGIYSLSAGIAATSTSSIILTGNGSLTIYDGMSGIVAGNVTVSSTGRLVIKENGTAQACCLKAESGTLTINSGTLELTSQNSNALYGSSIIINGGTITAIANNAHQDVTGDFFAFTSRPVFGIDYGHRVYAGTSASDAQLISAPTDSTFTASNYVRIEPVTGGNNGSSSNGGSGGGSGSRFSKGASSANSSIPETSGTWNQDQKGWRFAKPDGSNYTNEWVYVKNCWYRIGADGYMQQGWNTVDGKAYYLVPVSGEMKTGWLFDNNRWYYLVPASGEMKTGWVQVDGKWYYLNEDGTMASDAVTPDGYRVGADGAWVN